VGTGSFQG